MTVYCSKHVEDCKCLVTVVHYQKTPQKCNSYGKISFSFIAA